jgi:hypothetical protein
MRAADAKEPAGLRHLSVEALNKACAGTAASFPKWPAVLHSTDLSAIAQEQHATTHWWLADEAADGMYTFSYVSRGISYSILGLRRSGRKNKGKAPALPDAMEVDPPQRGRKRSAPTAAHDDGDNKGGDHDGDPTPRKTTASAGRPKLMVVIQSPPHTRPAQRLRIDVDAEAAEVDELASEPDAADTEGDVLVDEAAEVVEVAEVVEAADAADAADAAEAMSENLWVATGKVC